MRNMQVTYPDTKWVNFFRGQGLRMIFGDFPKLLNDTSYTIS